MQALFDSPRGRRVEIRMPLSEFLASRLMEKRARAALCTPGELVVGYLPVDCAVLDCEELALALAEACEAATEFSVTHIRLDGRDLRYAQRRLPELSGSTGPAAA